MKWLIIAKAEYFLIEMMLIFLFQKAKVTSIYYNDVSDFFYLKSYQKACSTDIQAR